MKNKELIQLCVAGGSIILLVFLNMFVLMSKNRKDAVPPAPPQPVAAPANSFVQNAPNVEVVEKQEAKNLFGRLKEKAMQLEYKRDPFQKIPDDITIDSAPVFFLEGIFWDTDKPTAIINDRIVEEGAVISGHTVVDIQKDRVIIDDGSSKRELFMDI